MSGVCIFLLFYLAISVAVAATFFSFGFAPLTLSQHEIIVFNALV